MTIDPAKKAEPLRSFGRRKGRPLSPRKASLMATVLPRLELDLSQPPPASLTTMFQSQVEGVALEIGFGGGEHLIAQAKARPNIGFIGCEPFEDGIAKVVAAIDQLGLQNVRLFGDDARKVISWLPKETISTTYILFPDPWPKARHAKRRLVNVALLQQLAPKMTPGAELRFATDIPDYLRTGLLAFRQTDSFEWVATTQSDWRLRNDENWPETRYEAKAIREGRRCYFLKYLRR